MDVTIGGEGLRRWEVWRRWDEVCYAHSCLVTIQGLTQRMLARGATIVVNMLFDFSDKRVQHHFVWPVECCMLLHDHEGFFNLETLWGNGKGWFPCMTMLYLTTSVICTFFRKQQAIWYAL